MTNVVTYKLLNEMLLQARAQMNAAEAHGMQTGLICGTQNIHSQDWDMVLRRELDCLVDFVPNILEQMEQLHLLTIKQLQSISFSFQPLLPEDDNDIFLRTMALADWCRGFLCGLGLAGVAAQRFTSKMAKETIKDLSLIAHVEAERNEEDVEAQEVAYSDLVEYIRMAVHGLHLELHGTKEDHGIGAGVEHQLTVH